MEHVMRDFIVNKVGLKHYINYTHHYIIWCAEETSRWIMCWQIIL
jgi:hypothetical protein